MLLCVCQGCNINLDVPPIGRDEVRFTDSRQVNIAILVGGITHLLQ